MATEVTALTQNQKNHSDHMQPGGNRPSASKLDVAVKWADFLGKLLPLVLGIGVLVVFGIFVKFLLDNTGAGETAWSRFIFVFGAVQTIALAATTFFFGKTVNSEQQKASDAKKGKAVAVTGLAQVVDELEKRLEQHEGMPDTVGFLRSLEELSKKNPQLTVGDQAFADHIMSVFPEEPPSGHRDLREIATLAQTALAQAESI